MIRVCVVVLFSALVIAPQLVRAQVTAAGSNLLRIGSGFSVNDADEESRKRYFEEIANARIFFENLSIGLRYEMDDPSEVGRSFQGLRRRWIQYKKDRVELQAGDVTALFGRGLAVNLFEARTLNYDTWLDGIYGQYEYLWPKEANALRPSVGIQAVAGKLDYFDILHDISNPNPDMRISARAANGEVGLLGRQVVLGASFLQANTEQDRMLFTNRVTTEREINQPDVYLSFFTGEFEGFLEYSEARSTLNRLDNKDTSVNHKGAAVYGSLSYANEDFGLTLEYKDYRYNLPTLGSPFTQYFNKLPLSSPPEVAKEHVYTSISRLTHAVNFNDEFGWQLELNVTAVQDIDLNIGASAASRHRAFADVTDSNGFRRVTLESISIIPEFKDVRYFPFWEAFAEVQLNMSDLEYAKFALHRTSNFDNNYLKMATTLVGKLQIMATETQSFLAILEHQWVYEEGRTTEDKTYLNELVTMQYSLTPTFLVGGIFDYSTRYEKPHHIWPQGFVSIRIGDSHTLLASYGSERGGLNCTGGICRVVPAFEGLRFTLTSQI